MNKNLRKKPSSKGQEARMHKRHKSSCLFMVCALILEETFFICETMSNGKHTWAAIHENTSNTFLQCTVANATGGLETLSCMPVSHETHTCLTYLFVRVAMCKLDMSAAIFSVVILCAAYQDDGHMPSPGKNIYLLMMQSCTIKVDLVCSVYACAKWIIGLGMWCPQTRKCRHGHSYSHNHSKISGITANFQEVIFIIWAFILAQE
jgi:hypothetical protein